MQKSECFDFIFSSMPQVFLLLCDAGDGDAIRALTVRLTAEERASLALIENTAKETVRPFVFSYENQM